MTRNREDRLFEHYRSTKNPRLLAKVFDRTAKELHRVASHLASDPHRAEDLVQNTFLTAIEDASSWNPDRPLLPWLLGILANRARYWRREERDVGAEVPDISYHSDPCDHAADSEFAQAAQEGIRELAEPHRQVLIMHLEHGMTAREIAEILHRPAGTVRTQVVRAMEMLRKALPAGFAAAAMASLSPAQSLAAVRAKLLASVSADSGLVASTATTGFLGGILVMNKTVMTLSAVAVAALSLWIFKPDSPWAGEKDLSLAASTSKSVTLAPEAEHAEPLREDVPTGFDALSESKQKAILAQLIAGLNPGSVQVRVRYEDGTPAPGIALHARMSFMPGSSYSITDADGTPVPVPEARESLDEVSLTDSEGLCTWEGLARSGHFWANAVQGKGSVTATVVGNKLTEVVLVLRGGMTIEGEVTDIHGQAVAGATIDAGGPTEWPQLLTHADAEGHFTLRCFSNRSLYARAEGYLGSRQYNPSGRVGTTQKLRMVLGKPGVRVAGQVLDRSGLPAVGVRVALIDISKRFVPTPVFVTTGEDGGFQSSSIQPGRHLLIASSTPENRETGIRSKLISLDVTTNGLRDITVRLIKGATVYGQISDLQGQPKQGVRIALRYRSPHAPNIPFALGWAHTDQEGRYCVEGLVPGGYLLETGSQLQSTDLSVELDDEQVFRWDPLHNKGMPLQLKIVDDAGNARADWEVTILNADGFYAGRRVTDDKGRCAFASLPSVEQQIWVTAPDVTHKDRLSPFPTVIPQPLSPGAHEHRITVRDTDLPSVVLSGRVKTDLGKVVTSGKVSIFRDGCDKSGAQLQLDENGCFEIGPIPAYRYRVGITVDGYRFHSQLCQTSPQTPHELRIVLTQK